MKTKFDKYFSAPQKEDLVVKRVAVNTEDTFFDVCTRYIPQSVEQTKALSKDFLKLMNVGQNAEMRQIVLAIYTFARFNVRYKLDRKGYEQIRLPRQIWADGIGDCEDFTILCSSILINLNIAHAVRMADYGNGWQHIYIKVGDICLDPVDAKFAHEDKGKYMNFKISPMALKLSKTWETPKNNGLGRVGIDAQKARIDGKFTDGGNVYKRQPNIKDQLITGQHCDISFSLDVEEEGYYALIPAELLQPSHLGNIENPLHFIPDAQPRNRAMSASGANTPRLIAEKLRPAEITEGSTAYSGTPIINERGEIIQGNGRGYTMKVYWDEFAQIAPNKYLNYLKNNLIKYFLTFDGEKLLQNLKVDDTGLIEDTYKKIKVKNPVLVRVIPCTDDEAIRLGQFKQADLEAVSTRTNDIKSKVALIDDKTVQDILRKVFPDSEQGGDATITELIRNSGVSSLLISRKIYRQDEFLENFVNQRTNELNSDGVHQITDLIVGLIFKGNDTNTPELFRLLPDRIQVAIAKSARYILDATPEYSIANDVGKSIRGVVGYTNTPWGFEEWISQTSMFGELKTVEYSPLQLALIKLMGDAKTQKEIILAFKNYHFNTHDEVRTGFDFSNEPLRKALSKADALKKVFGVMEKGVEVKMNKPLTEKEQFAKTTFKVGMVGSFDLADNLGTLHFYVQKEEGELEFVIGIDPDSPYVEKTLNHYLKDNGHYENFKIWYDNDSLKKTFGYNLTDVDNLISKGLIKPKYSYYGYQGLRDLRLKFWQDTDFKNPKSSASQARAEIERALAEEKKEVAKPIMSKELQAKSDKSAKELNDKNDTEIQKNRFLNQVVADYSKKVKHTRLSLEKLALSFGIDSKNQVKELNELAVVRHCREIASNFAVTDRQKYDQIVAFYNQQANSSHRTSESIMFQQYSTPSPIAFLMGKFCKIDKPFVLANSGVQPHQFYEPSAGNGILTIVGNPLLFDVNEVSPFRNSNLKIDGYGSVTKLDTSVPYPQLEKKYNAVLTNPPFGRLAKSGKVDGYKISELDHLMSINALDCMKDDGRAAIIIGGNTEYDSEGRIQSGKNRIFLSYLYEHYNVVDVVNLDGSKLYSRQGTSFNVRVILIDGRKNVPEGYAPLYNKAKDSQVKDFDTLYNRIYALIDTPKVNVVGNKKLALKYKYRLRLQLQELELKAA